MKQTKQKTPLSRRQFLRNAAITGGAAAAAAAAPEGAIADATPVPDEQTEEGYRLTQHILDYYKSAAS